MSYESDDESISSGPVTTNTLLGYVDVPISDSNPLYPTDSFIGGQPLPMDKNSPIPFKLVHCKNCKSPMRLLNQTRAELDGTWYDRSLYVFICIEQKCRRKPGAIRAIRGIKKDQKIMKQRQEEEKRRIEQERLVEARKLAKEEENKNLVKDLFGSSKVTANPFASNPFASNPFASSLDSNPFETAKASSKAEKVQKEKTETSLEEPITDDQPLVGEVKKANYKLPEFKGFILYFETEKLDPANQVVAPIPDNLKIDESGATIEDTSDTGSVQTGNLPKINPNKAKEQEDLSKIFDDQTFQNFTRILSYNTTQVVRYEPNGSPILYSSKGDVARIFYTPEGKFKRKEEWSIPNPAYNSGGTRRFEMQLMPKMIIDLEEDITDVNMIMKNGMEWGTIIVATDSDDFVPLNWFDKNGVAYVEEWCGVQWEDEVKQ